MRGSAIDLNYLEQYKMRKDQRLVELAEMELALTLSALAEMLVAHVGIHRECVLSAFSLHPTPERFSKLLQLQVNYLLSKNHHSINHYPSLVVSVTESPQIGPGSKPTATNTFY